MLTAYLIIVGFFYLTLALELTVWHVPSVASSLELFSKNDNHMKQFSDRIRALFEWPLAAKVVIFILPLFFVYLVHLFPLLPFISFLKQDIDLTGHLSMAIVGIILVLIGRGISLIYLFTIRSMNTNRLVAKGIFRLSRNPGLIGLYISFIGFFMLTPTTLFGISILIYMAHMHGKVLIEEDFLARKFKTDYEQYKSSTSRYLW